MLQVDLIQCSKCVSILDTLCLIDERLAKLADNHYKNIVFELSLHHPKEIVNDLLHYKRILTKKLFNPSYTDYSQNVLISRTKVLLNG